MATKIATKSLCNLCFDLLTILISFADVTTDIIVLIDFYQKDRMVFFGISLTILILAQCAYSVAFGLDFEIFEGGSGWSWCSKIVAFFCLLPFGVFVPMAIFMNQNGLCPNCIYNTFDLGNGSWFRPSKDNGDLANWIKTKLNKHLGFLIEAAIEAFPQSLLQIIAIVYFQEANYISIISILLSMFSVMTKSLVLSRGLEQYTFAWTWLCVVTDFFGIFFTLTWVFYSNDTIPIPNIFLSFGYFNILATIWMWKVAIAIVIPVAIGIVCAGFYCIFAYFYQLYEGEITSGDCRRYCLIICSGPVFGVMALLAIFLVAEIFCFLIFAIFVKLYCTDRYSDHQKIASIKVINAVIKFCEDGNRNEQIMRIVALNHGAEESCDGRVRYGNIISKSMRDWIDELNDYDELKKVSYWDIRDHSPDPTKAHLFKKLYGKWLKPFRDMMHELTNNSSTNTWYNRCLAFMVLIPVCYFTFIAIPVYALSKVLQIFYPWIILGYLIVDDKFGDIDSFQLVMLMVYLLFQIVLLFLSVKALKRNWILWHFAPGRSYMSLSGIEADKMIEYSEVWINDKIWLPKISPIILNSMGNDIGRIVIHYLQSMQLGEDHGDLRFSNSSKTMGSIASGFCNIGYDLLTILISIADVTTDVIVLIDFYNKDRMTFFSISLAILILAQCSYSIAFAVKFNTIDSWEWYNSCGAFCCCLPFGTIVAFLIYFASEESGCGCFRDYIKYDMGLEADSWFNPKSTDNKMVKFIKRKLDKHLGFILEALIEAFPQSLLQIIAIVYFQEANYISIISILISMCSVMTKSLILSQGVEKYTFIWTWLCVVTDFFGIFFTLTWVFYSNDLIHGEYWGYFNIFGIIWIWKVLVSIVFPVAIGVVFYVLILYPVMYFFIIWDTSSCSSCCGYSCLWCCTSPIVVCILAFAVCLASEVLCLSIIAFGVFMFGTDRINGYRTDKVSEMVSNILDFMWSGKDKKMRILAVNRAMNKVAVNQAKTLSAYIDETAAAEGYEGLKRITYSDMRQNCSNPKVAAFFKDVFSQIIKGWKEFKREVDRAHNPAEKVYLQSLFVAFSAFLFWFVPVLFLSKSLQIVYPWIILGYLLANNLLFTEQIDLFQLVMLAIYCGLQLLVLFLGIHVGRIQWWLWHIDVGKTSANWGGISPQKVTTEMNAWYEKVYWYPKAAEIVYRVMGNDIGAIVMDYCKNFELDKQSGENLI